MKSLFIFASLMLFLHSCTIVTSKNSPGKAEDKFPKAMQGKYELVYPESFQGLMDGAELKTIVIIKSNEIIMNTGEGDSHMLLNDSISLNKLGKSYYLCMGKAPMLNVFKMVKKGKNFELYAMNAVSDVTEDQMKAYFSAVETISETDEETGEVTTSYSVTIDENKIESYFKSDIIEKEPFVLKRTK